MYQPGQALIYQDEYPCYVVKHEAYHGQVLIQLLDGLSRYDQTQLWSTEDCLKQPVKHHMIDRKIENWSRSSPNPWTGRQLRTLKRIWHSSSKKEIALRTGHSYESGRRRMLQWWGSGGKCHKEHYSLQDLKSIFGTSSRTVLKWLQTGVLVGVRYGENGFYRRGAWRVSPDALMTFVKSSPMHYDYSRLDLEPYRTVAREVYAKRPYYTPGEVARLMKVPYTTVLTWVREGLIPSERHDCHPYVVWAPDIRRPRSQHVSARHFMRGVTAQINQAGYLTSTDAARLLCVQRTRIRQLVTQGDLLGTLMTLGGRRFLAIKRDDLTAYEYRRDHHAEIEGDVLIPQHIIGRLDLTPAAKLAYAVVCHVSQNGEPVRLPAHILAGYCGLKQAWFSTCISKLIEAHLLERPSKRTLRPVDQQSSTQVA